MNDEKDEIAELLDEVYTKWSASRRTFTEREALQSVWNAGYEIPIQADHRFVLVHEGNGKHPSHWRLTHQAVANTRLLNDLLAGTWDGRDLEAKLAELDSEDQRHYIFYPLDARLNVTKQGTIEPAEHERNVKLTRAMKAPLDALGQPLLTCWHEAGDVPWTVRTVLEQVQQLGWQDAEKPNSWLFVRAWLLGWSHVVRVGQDYWIPDTALPQEVQRTRLQVLPLRLSDSSSKAKIREVPPRNSVTSTAKTSNSQEDES